MIEPSTKPDARPPGITRRGFLKSGAVIGTGGALATGVSRVVSGSGAEYPGASVPDPPPLRDAHRAHGMGGTIGSVGDAQRPIDPLHYLTAFNKTEFPPQVRLGGEDREFYRESKDRYGRTLREYLFVAVDREIEIAPGIYFPAWTYNGQVPGPTIRANEGDLIRIWFLNQGSHPHTIHFHGWHPFEQDGSMVRQFVHPNPRIAKPVSAPFGPGADPDPWLAIDREKLRQHGFEIYEFDAEPVGLHLYHCHSLPLKRHIHKGLYGAFIVDPIGGRPKIDPETNQLLPTSHPLREMVMVMNGFDTNFDNENEVYAVNSVAFQYQANPIPVKMGELVRIYLINVTEFDPINSFHLHAGFFRIYRTGTNLKSEEFTDTAMFCQGERAILEMRFREGWPGRFMFHAHQSEFAELGWMSLFDAQEPESLA